MSARTHRAGALLLFNLIGAGPWPQDHMRSHIAKEDLDRSLADQNIKRLQKLLRGCTNNDEREVLLGLLAEEEIKLKQQLSITR